MEKDLKFGKPLLQSDDDSNVPFGAEFLEELPVVEGLYGATTRPTSACTGLQTGGGDDPLPETQCC